MSKDTPEKSAIDISQVLEVLKTLLPQGVATAEMAQKAFSMALERQGARSPFETFKATTADDVSPVLAIDPENRIAYANKSAETLFGSLAETLKERSILEWLPKEEATAFGAKLDVFRARQAGLPTEAQTERSVLTLRMDTHKVQTRYNLVPAGENLGIILNDMGERETLKAAVNYLPCGVSVIDRDLRVIAWNEEVLRLQDYSRHLFKNRLPTFGEVVRDICERGDYGEVDTEAKVAEMEALAHKFEPHHIVRERSDGTVLDIRGAPIPGGGFVTTYTDVTEQHRQEMEIKRLVKELAQANQAKSTFLAAASHDLRQPMQAITLFTAALADILREKSATDLDLARHITKSLEGSVDSLGALLNSILDISKMEAGVVVPEIKVFDIDDVLSQLVRQTQATVDKKGLRLSYVPCHALVKSDPALLLRMVGNLLSNAVRYTPKGRILLGCRREGEKLSVQVWDTGIGIPENRLEEIFDDFTQLGKPRHSREHGMGLGLAIVRRMVDLLGHPVDAQSEPGKGSVFSIELPLCHNLENDEDDKKADPAKGRISPGSTVLVIEDDPLVLSGTGVLLDQWGCDSLLSESTEAALDQLDKTGKQPDLILADFRLAEDETGVDAIAKVRQKLGKQVPAIVLTGDTGVQSLRDVSASNCLLLHKPLEPRKLRQSIMEILNGENLPKAGATR